MGAVTEAETEGAVDEGRATERVLSLISTPEQETWMAQYFVKSRRERDGWGRRRVRLWFKLRPNEVRQATGPTLEIAIEVAQEMQRADQMIAVHGRMIA